MWVFQGRWSGEGSGGFWAGLKEWGAHGAHVANTLEMEEDIGKTHVAQRRPARPMKELGVGNTGNGARKAPEQGVAQSGSESIICALHACKVTSPETASATH